MNTGAGKSDWDSPRRVAVTLRIKRLPMNVIAAFNGAQPLWWAGDWKQRAARDPRNIQPQRTGSTDL